MFGGMPYEQFMQQQLDPGGEQAMLAAQMDDGMGGLQGLAAQAQGQPQPMGVMPPPQDRNQPQPMGVMPPPQDRSQPQGGGQPSEGQAIIDSMRRNYESMTPEQRMQNAEQFQKDMDRWQSRFGDEGGNTRDQVALFDQIKEGTGSQRLRGFPSQNNPMQLSDRERRMQSSSQMGAAPTQNQPQGMNAMQPQNSQIPWGGQLGGREFPFTGANASSTQTHRPHAGPSNVPGMPRPFPGEGPDHGPVRNPTGERPPLRGPEIPFDPNVGENAPQPPPLTPPGIDLGADMPDMGPYQAPDRPNPMETGGPMEIPKPPMGPMGGGPFGGYDPNAPNTPSNPINQPPETPPRVRAEDWELGGETEDAPRPPTDPFGNPLDDPYPTQPGGQHVSPKQPGINFDPFENRSAMPPKASMSQARPNSLQGLRAQAQGQKQSQGAFKPSQFNPSAGRNSLPSVQQQMQQNQQNTSRYNDMMGARNAARSSSLSGRDRKLMNYQPSAQGKWNRPSDKARFNQLQGMKTPSQRPNLQSTANRAKPRTSLPQLYGN
jgi:hypothetical protein